MTTGARTASRGRRWLIGTALVAGAGLLSAITPTDDALLAPFLARADAGDRATSRSLSAQIVSATFAERVVADGGDWEAEGNWLVVEIVASASRTEMDAEVALATLHVDGLVFQASERVPETLRGARMHVGTDTAGFLVFELAEGIRGGEAELRLTAEATTPRLDDVLSLRVPLDDAPQQSTAEVREPTVVAS